GILFHVMLTGHLPKRHETSQQSPALDSKASTVSLGPLIVDSQWRHTIEHLPSPWKKIVMRCLSPRPENRFCSAEAVIDALKTGRSSRTWSATAAVVAATP